VFAVDVGGLFGAVRRRDSARFSPTIRGVRDVGFKWTLTFPCISCATLACRWRGEHKSVLLGPFQSPPVSPVSHIECHAAVKAA